MQYSIYKDNDVVSTVKKIKKILDDIGVKLEEDILERSIKNEYMPYSMRVSVFGITKYGTNGKGTCLENCRASAYSEFIERIQNQYIFQNIIDYEKRPLNKFTVLDKYYNKEFLDFINKEVLFGENQSAVEFYNYKTGKTEYIPFEFLIQVQASNGMCAGNTLEEALVQGFSEICERYASANILSKGISIPDIPKEEYEKYDKIKGMIDYLGMYGFSVRIKDASIGQKLPVACAVLENKKEGIFSFRFGSQPSMLVAIERTLTEFMQANTMQIPYIIKYNSSMDLKSFGKYINFSFNNDTGKYLQFDNPIYKFLTQDNTDYQFDKNAWIDTDKKYTNKELLKILTDRIGNITNNDIFIRDVSFLGFPAYYIYVPGISDDKDNYILRQKSNYIIWVNYTKDRCPEHKDINSLISALGYFIINKPKLYISNIDDRYLLLLCYIVTKDTKNIISYSQQLTENHNLKNKKQLMKLINKYYSLKDANVPENETDTEIQREFTKEEIASFKKFIHYLDFDKIKRIIIADNIKNAEQAKIPEQNEFEDKIEEIKLHLAEKYQENTPNQMKLKEVLSF